MRIRTRTSSTASEPTTMQWGGGSGEGVTGGNRAFNYLGPNTASLNVRMDTRQTMADGTTLRTWSFGRGFNGNRSVPGPVIEGIEGETVQVTLESGMPHSIHLHGLDVNQANDGVPSTSGYVARMGGGGMMNFGRVDGYTNLGSPFTYTFIAPHAGTYMYYCHVDTVLHVEMGMYGTVIIRPPDGRPTLPGMVAQPLIRNTSGICTPLTARGIPVWAAWVKWSVAPERCVTVRIISCSTAVTATTL